MIDTKVLEKIAQLDDATILRRLPDNERFFFEYGFQRGYNRALKNLWHPASEEPEIKDVNIAYLDKHGLLEALYFERSPIENWDEKVSIYQIDKWTYLSDLLPKEGGNHD